jgi:hypothetical protein
VRPDDDREWFELTDGRDSRLTRSIRTPQTRLGFVALACSLLVGLSACEVGSTDISGGTGPTATASTGPIESTEPTAATGPTSGGVDLEGTWSGTWETDVPQVHGTFSWVIESTPDGFRGTIHVDDTTCVSNGSVEVTLDGDRIRVGLVQAEQPVTFTGTVSGDEMSGIYDAGTCPPPNAGTWEAVRSA